MKKNYRKSISDNLNRYDILCNDPNGFIEVTQWTNLSGFDILMSKNGKELLISLTDGELEAINHLVRELDASSDSEFEEN